MSFTINFLEKSYYYPGIYVKMWEIQNIQQFFSFYENCEMSSRFVCEQQFLYRGERITTETIEDTRRHRGALPAKPEKEECNQQRWFG